jgi:twitching motility protein PilJ
MARRSANPLLNSLKDKIRLAAAALAFFVCAFGVASYLLASFFINETFYAVFIPFLLLSFTVVIFGSWLSNEVVSPIEKVSLLAKSLERSSLVSLPKTTGSTETDELLATLHRSSQQLQTIVGLMETVAAGNVDVALTPLENSDRLSGSFQKLLAKVTDSIDAKQRLEKLETEIRRLAEETARVRRGNLDAEISGDFQETREISETMKFLVRNLNELIAQVRQNSAEAHNSGVEAQKTIRAVIGEDENAAQKLGQAALLLKQTPFAAQKISEELSGSISFANQSIEKARKGSQTAQESLNAVGGLRRQIQESIKRINRLGECSQEITKVAKAVDDLAQRTNLIALNASIQSVENGDKSYGFAILAEEVERLSARAENTNKEISSLNKSIAAEIVEVENSLSATAKEAANLSRYAIETENSLSELEKYVGGFMNLQTRLASYSLEQFSETEKSLNVFSESISMAEKSVADLKKSENNISRIVKSLENLQSSTGNFTTAQTIENEPEINAFENRTSVFAETAEEFEPVVIA